MEDKPPEVKLTVVWLITNGATNMLGITTISRRRFQFETNLDPDWIQKTLAALPKMFLQEEEEVWIKNYVAYQIGDGDELGRNSNLCRALAKPFGRASEGFRKAILKRYPVLRSYLSPTQGLPKPFPALNANGLPGNPPSGASPGGEGLPKPQHSTAQHSTVPEGECEGKAQIPTWEEFAAAFMADAIPEEWLRRQFDWLNNNHGWLTPHGRLKKWPNIVRSRWADDRAGWQARKTVPTEKLEGLEDIDAELQWNKDPARRAELKKQRDKLAK